MPRAYAAFFVVLIAAGAVAQTAHQPKVAPGPNEPNWDVVLKSRYGLSMFDDLLNPVQTTTEATPGLFKKAGPGPVRVRPGNRPRSRNDDARRLVSARRDGRQAGKVEPLVVHV